MNSIKKIKENLKDPKKKSLTLLGFYFLFFVFVFIALSSKNDVKLNEEKVSIEDNYKNMTSYNFTIKYYKNDIIDIIDGIYYNKKALINYNLLKYYYEDNYYLIDNDSYYLYDIQYKVDKFFNINFFDLFDNLIEESKTIYKDGRIQKNYNIDSNIIYNYLYGLEGTYDNNINISIIELDNYITNITLELSNLMLDINKIEIEYNNINQINNLEFNKEDYLYRE